MLETSLFSTHMRLLTMLCVLYKRTQERYKPFLAISVDADFDDEQSTCDFSRVFYFFIESKEKYKCRH